jgi:hypothetical protein|tara:strand:- start:12425 stop:13135 length:711 start_codon:yes stop_codon:yes gene_type:complete
MFRTAAADAVRLASPARPRVGAARRNAPPRWHAVTGGSVGDGTSDDGMSDASIEKKRDLSLKQPPKRASGRVTRRRLPGACEASTNSAPQVRRRAVRKTNPTGTGDDRGRLRSDFEKASAMSLLKTKVAAPEVAALAQKVAAACAVDAHRDAAAAYGSLKKVQHGDIPPAVFENMLAMYARLIMSASAEGVFIDALSFGKTPTEDACWALLRAFERAEEQARADKVLLYMETRGMV